MKSVRVLFPAAFVLLLSATGCLFHTRPVEVRVSSAKLQTATQQELIDRLNHDAGLIKTLNATVDIDSSVGGEKKGKVTDFKEIRGYVLVRKPNQLRMIGLYPIVRNKAFDIVSDGQEFKLSVPATNKFYIGHNQVIKDSTNPSGHGPSPEHLRCPTAAGGRSPKRSRRSGEQHGDGRGRPDPQAGAATELCVGRDPARRPGLDPGAESRVRPDQPEAPSPDHV